MRRISLFSSGFLFLAVLSGACAQPLVDDSGMGGSFGDGSGGSSSSGGSTYSGGTTSSGGFTSSGGTSSGGTSSGGSASGGTSSGGTSSGGTSSGGTSSGGTSSGGSASGGAAGTGGSSGGSCVAKAKGETTLPGTGTVCYNVDVSGGTTMYGWNIYRNCGRTLTIDGSNYSIAASGDSGDQAPLASNHVYKFEFSAPTTSCNDMVFNWW